MKMSLAYAELSGTSPESPCALPDRWVERIFQRMEDRFGDLWATRYGAFPRERVKQTWAEDLADLSPDEIARGMDRSKSAKFPPTLPEFRLMCRPPIDFEDAFVEAVRQMAERDSGRDKWSSPAIFWAAVTIGSFDLRNGTWATLEKRWRKVLQAEIDKGEWQPVPERVIALPQPAPTKETREAAEKFIRAAGLKLKTVGDTTWAQKILDRIASGEVVPFQAEKMAKAVIPEAA